ncbi:GrpE protein [Candidatus Thiomargarita nelsonii]|uniref:GrpE protein n=1 Tax=Candidatus Thiomargarita nelsonii TaxID=1003181 RepID=A0A176S424_9GAMM|nr:GrpE protein [Candidatus Thiomargarita nelsonii]
MDEDSTQKTDLFSLFTELAALRNEVKLESRQVKIALDLFKNSLETTQSSYDQLHQEFKRSSHEQRNHKREIMQPLLLGFLDIYDRLEAGMKSLNNYTNTSSLLTRYFCKQERRLIQGLQEGQAMTLRRTLQLLARYQVHPLEVLNKPLDPHTMWAVDVDSQPKLENGIVTEELRKGFMWGKEVLRIAEVKVNKK